eukprot:g4224.t1
MSSGPNLPGYRSNKTFAKPRPNASALTDKDHTDGDWYASSNAAYSGTAQSLTKSSFTRVEPKPHETVLTFDAHWIEEVFDSDERFRCRMVRIMYVVEDGTVKVFEKKKVENSGMTVGVFLKRGRVPKSDGGFVGIADLKIGETINLYNRSFVIHGCSEETRRYLDKTGLKVPPNQVMPEDDFMRRRHASKNVSIKLKKTPMKIYVEALNGKPVDAVTKLGPFLKHGGKVLRFYACWDDRASLYGDLNRYIIHYFLADGTTEIREVKIPNSGKADFTLMLGRTKLPKDWKKDVHEVEKSKDPARYVNERDLFVGAKLNVYGKELLLTSCDGFTQQYYTETYGFSSENFKEIVVDDGKKPLPKNTIAPAHFGGVACFGTEEDSLQSCLSLHPKPIKRDIEKLMLNQKNLLRFGARLDTTKPEDIDRKFIITYYMADDTIAVFEDVARNSGRMPGKFLRRMKLRNVATGKYFKPDDFKKGTFVNINNFRFFVNGMDDFTKLFTVSVKDVLLRLHKNFVHVATDDKGDVAGNRTVRIVKGIFASMDKDKSGFITLPELKQYIKDVLKEQMEDKEVLAAMHFFDTDRDGRVSLEEFKLWLRSDPNMWGNIGKSDTLGDFAGVYRARLAGATGQEATTFKLKVALKRYAQAFNEKEHDFLQIFEKYDKSKSGTVTREEFLHALDMANKFAPGGIDSSFPLLIADYMFDEDCRFLSYRKFLGLLARQGM